VLNLSPADSLPRRAVAAVGPKSKVTALIRDYLDRPGAGEEVSADPLTPREVEIVKLAAEGNTTDEIAETLVISKKTVEHHRSHILEKLGMRDRVKLTRYAIRRGLVEP
jgi:DNA-binding NarL/FixJ family response regulator